MAIQSIFYTVFTAEPSALAVVPSPSRDVVDMSSQLAVGSQLEATTLCVPDGPTPLGGGYQGDPRSNQEQRLVRAWAVPPHSLGGGYQGDGLVLEEVSIGMAWNADEQR